MSPKHYINLNWKYYSDRNELLLDYVGYASIKRSEPYIEIERIYNDLRKPVVVIVVKTQVSELPTKGEVLAAKETALRLVRQLLEAVADSLADAVDHVGHAAATGFDFSPKGSLVHMTKDISGEKSNRYFKLNGGQT